MGRVLRLMVAAGLAHYPAIGSFEVVNFATGSDSSIFEPRTGCATTADEWRQIWLAHQADNNITTSSAETITHPLPSVDFKQFAVVAVFGGSTRRIARYRIVSASADKETATITVAPEPAPNATVGLLLTPYAFITIPRSRKAVELRLAPERTGDKAELIGRFEIPKLTTG